MKAEFSYIWTDKKRTFLGLPISFTRYFLTETKVVIRKGFLNVTETEFELYKVKDKKLMLPFGQRIVGCGTVIVQVSDMDSDYTEIKSIKKPRVFLEKFEAEVNKQRDKYRTRGRDMAGALGFPDGMDYCGCHDDDNDDDNA